MSRVARRDIDIRINAAQRFTLAYRDVNGAAIPLVGYGARAMLRGSYDDLQPILSLTAGAGITLAGGDEMNLIEIALTQAQATTFAQARARGVWDLWLDPSGSPDEASTLVLEGEVRVLPTATR